MGTRGPGPPGRPVRRGDGPRGRVRHRHARYNYGFPGALKNLLDSLYDEWNRKPFGLVGAGGMAGGARAIDGLRIVLPGVAAISVPASVLVPSVATEFTAAGPNDPVEVAQATRTDVRVSRWYARALQLARQTTPP